MTPIHYDFMYSSHRYRSEENTVQLFYRTSDTKARHKNIVFCRTGTNTYYTVHEASAMSPGNMLNIWATNGGLLIALGNPGATEDGKDFLEWLNRVGFKVKPPEQEPLLLEHVPGEPDILDTPCVDAKGEASIPLHDLDGLLVFEKRLTLGEYLFHCSTYELTHGNEHRYYLRAEFDSTANEWRFYITDRDGNYVGVKRWYYTLDKFITEILRVSFPTIHRETADSTLLNLIAAFRVYQMRVQFDDA